MAKSSTDRSNTSVLIMVLILERRFRWVDSDSSSSPLRMTSSNISNIKLTISSSPSVRYGIFTFCFFLSGVEPAWSKSSKSSPSSSSSSSSSPCGKRNFLPLRKSNKRTKLLKQPLDPNNNSQPISSLLVNATHNRKQSCTTTISCSRWAISKVLSYPSPNKIKRAHAGEAVAKSACNSSASFRISSTVSGSNKSTSRFIPSGALSN